VDPTDEFFPDGLRYRKPSFLHWGLNEPDKQFEGLDSFGPDPLKPGKDFRAGFPNSPAGER